MGATRFISRTIRDQSAVQVESHSAIAGGLHRQSTIACQQQSRTLRAQSAVEYASLVAIVLIILIPVAYIGLTSIEDWHRGSQAAVSVSALVDAADLVSVQGPGARTSVDLAIPRGVNPAKTGLYGKEIRINIFTMSGTERDYFALTKCNLTGTLPVAPGRHRLRVEMLSSGVVQVTEP